MAKNGQGARSVALEAVSPFPDGWRTAYLVVQGLLLAMGLGIAALEEFLWNGRIGSVVKALAVVEHGGGIAPFAVLTVGSTSLSPARFSP